MKKIISMTLVIALALSMVFAVSAADGTITVGKVTTADKLSDSLNEVYYSVPITLSNFYAYNDFADFVGYNTATVYVLYDSTKLIPGIKTARTTLYGSATTQLTMTDPSSGAATSASGFTYSVQDVDETHKRICVLMKEGAGVIDGTDLGTGILTYVHFRPAEGATGKTELTVVEPSFGLMGLPGGVSEHTDYTIVPGEIDLGTPVVETKYTVTASAGANGSISPAGATEATEGTKISYTITADAGYVIDTITIDGTPDTSKAGQASATYEYTVGTSNGTIAATFKAEETETTIKTMPNRYKDGDAIYTLGKVVEGTNGCSRYGVAVYSEKRGQEVYYSGSGKTAKGFYVVGFRGTAFDSEAATRAFADTDDGRIFGDSVTAIYGE